MQEGGNHPLSKTRVNTSSYVYVKLAQRLNCVCYFVLYHVNEICYLSLKYVYIDYQAKYVIVHSTDK